MSTLSTVLLTIFGVHLAYLLLGLALWAQYVREEEEAEDDIDRLIRETLDEDETGTR